MSFTISPVARQQFFDANGKPLAGGKLYTYAAGTTTPLASYSDSVGTPNTNPIILDAGGFATIFLQNLAYKYVLTDANDNPQWTVDGITLVAPPAAGGAVTGDDQTVAFSATPAFVGLGQIEVFRMTLTGNVTSSTLSMPGIPAPTIITFKITQDGVGGRTFVWPANLINPTPVLGSPNAITTQLFFWDGSTGYPLGPGVYS